MFSNRIYYSFKPFIPRPMRLAMRRWVTRQRLAVSGEIWPIKPSAAQPPEGWPGWPGQRQFAIVLTHDVEGPKGLERVRKLARLEKESGFRSAFNLIPEGDYQAPGELRKELQSDGFEVGIHDLRHDGKLYRSREEFLTHAKRINHYLSTWNAVGFRSGFMLRNLSWLGDLEIKYDASTFDTDPFEPQPDGANTIFPFWVPRAKGNQGYIELPYTLPQDSTLFMLLGEKDINVWKRKLDWVVEKKGMVLLNVHPDYMSFGAKPENGEFPAEWYRELLEYVKTKYQGLYWQALPREVAEYCEAFRPRRATRPKRVCMLAYSFYESDNRIRRYTESLARRGDQVDVISLRRGAERGEEKREGNVLVHGLQRRLHNEKGKLSYFARVVRYCATSSVFLAREHWAAKYDLIHVHNIPDFLVFSALVPKLSGAKVILDIHDIVPEFYTSKFGGKASSLTVSLLKWIERRSTRFADHVIISNHLWNEKITARSVPPERCSTFINNVDPAIFYRRERTRRDGKFIVLFPGSLQWHQGLDIAIRAIGIIRDKAPDIELHIYGEGGEKANLLKLIEELKLQERVKFQNSRSLTEIADVIANADLGVVPKRADSFGNEAYSTKIMEFMSQGVPVVVSRTKIDSFYFDEETVRFFESGNETELADAILTLRKNQAMREKLTEHGFRYVAKNSWATKEEEYLNLVDSLMV